MKKINYSRQSILKDDLISVRKNLNSDFITRGPTNKKFEKKLSKFVDSKYCLTTNSATSGLYIACKALGLKENDIVWTSPNSFVASANCAIMCGAKIDFVDINLNSYNLDIKILEKK